MKTCTFPLEFPPAKIYRVGCMALMEHTEARHSPPKKEWTLFPVSWKTSTRRGWAMLPTMKQSSCLGSHTAWNLVSHRPVIVLCLVGTKQENFKSKCSMTLGIIWLRVRNSIAPKCWFSLTSFSSFSSWILTDFISPSPHWQTCLRYLSLSGTELGASCCKSALFCCPC